MKQNGGKFIPLNRRITIIIFLTLAIGIGGISFYFASSLTGVINTSTRQDLLTHSETLFEAVETIMLSGEAPVAVRFFTGIREVNPEYKVFLYRVDGTPAFRDDSTIEEVNAILGRKRFMPMDDVSIPMSKAGERFGEALSGIPSNVLFTQREGTTSYYRLYKPLINLPACTECHGSDHTIRGVIDIHRDISKEVRQRESSMIIASFMFLGVVLILSGVITQFLRRSVINPVKAVGAVCTAVTGGQFDRRVNIQANNEIGELGKTVNNMVTGLKERSELTKYVSNTTLKALTGDQEGKTAELTVLFSDIRGFTAFAETHSADRVVTCLNRVLNHQTEVIHRLEGDVDKYVADAVVAVFPGAEGPVMACRAAVQIQQDLASDQRLTEEALRVGIGINSGEVILGMIGSKTRADYTIIGDTVNIASRMCDTAHAGEIIVSEEIYRSLGERADGEGPFLLRMKGRTGKVKVFKLKGIRE
ncbi:MAG: adenylate/guanylate cyclase domain-containing protein [Spirochaetia bacterium]